MRIKCPSCGKAFQVLESVALGKGKCPHCGQKLDLGRMQRPEDPHPGDVLGGCRIEGRLGRCGMAVVSCRWRVVARHCPTASRPAPVGRPD